MLLSTVQYITVKTYYNTTALVSYQVYLSLRHWSDAHIYCNKQRFSFEGYW